MLEEIVVFRKHPEMTLYEEMLMMGQKRDGEHSDG